MEKNIGLLVEMTKQNRTQQELADAIGISVGSFNLKINGHRQFTVKEVKKMIDYLNLDQEQVSSIFFAK